MVFVCLLAITTTPVLPAKPGTRATPITYSLTKEFNIGEDLHWANALALSGNGRTLASVRGSSKSIDLWDTQTGARLDQIPLGNEMVNDIACSSNADYIAGQSYGLRPSSSGPQTNRIIVWSVKSKRVIFKHDFKHQIGGFTFGPSDATIVVTTCIPAQPGDVYALRSDVYVYDLVSSKLVRHSFSMDVGYETPSIDETGRLIIATTTSVDILDQRLRHVRTVSLPDDCIGQEAAYLGSGLLLIRIVDTSKPDYIDRVIICDTSNNRKSYPLPDLTEANSVSVAASCRLFAASFARGRVKIWQYSLCM
ncbi:MAG TPA: hypothetical protein VGK19_07745 [Capsulimonadaceae bacterium]|jgi:hypothetical protein